MKTALPIALLIAFIPNQEAVTQNIDAPPVTAAYCQVTKTADGHLRIFIPQDAVDFEEVGAFCLRPRIVGEKDCRTDTIFIRMVADGYEFATTKGFSVNSEGKILFYNERVDAFDVFKTP